MAFLLMINPDTRHTVKTIMKEGQSAEQKEYRVIHTHVGGWVISQKKSFFSPNIRNDDRFAQGLFGQFPLKSVAAVPLLIEGILLGALIILFHDAAGFAASEMIDSLENLAAISVPFLRNAQKIREYFYPDLPDASLLLKYKNTGLIGKSPPFIDMLHTIDAAAKCNARALLIGKTGTGKELIARAIHHYSARSEGPFLAVDCGAIPAALLESELFGHTRGAFTGAHSERPGIFLETTGGTLFMDEINNLPLEIQSKLLRVMEEGKVRPLGSDKTVDTDVRIITASSVPLKKLVDEQRFREDLFYRLHVYPIYIPDLSDRWQDIAMLANHFLQLYAQQEHKKVSDFHEEMIEFIRQRTWNGNIRELENFVERLVTLAPEETSTIGKELLPGDLQEEFRLFREKQQGDSGSQPLKARVQAYEAHLIRETLETCGWNQSRAARLLQISEKNIRYRMDLLDIRKPE
jgi:Nif-specific regulatory protein